MKNSEINPSKANILVVDDTPANLRLLVGILADKGYSIRPARDGFQALAIAQGVPLDLILLDINMPQMDGYEVCSKLKADERTREIPVIFVSALSEVLDKVKAFEVGGVDYITKPFQVEEVLARIETHLALQRLQKNLQSKNDELAQKNEELANTLQQLKATQEELVNSEKMAALGHLIAGVAHEINTPLGAIRSSIGNLEYFLIENLKQLPAFFQGLSQENQQYFFELMQKINQQTTLLSTKEKRQLKKTLQRQLQERQIEDVENVASTLVNIGILYDIEPFIPLLKDPDGEKILKTAYEFASVYKSIKTITTATERAAKFVFALKSYARYDYSGEKPQSNIIEGIETVITLYQNQLKPGVKLIKNYEELPLISCYSDELNQVWTNLIHNALQAMEYKGTLTIDVRKENQNVMIGITDSGKGIPPEIMPKIFTPFFTTKPAGEGSGLGLDIVRKIIEKHQGKIEVESIPGKTTFTVSIPLGV